MIFNMERWHAKTLLHYIDKIITANEVETDTLVMKRVKADIELGLNNLVIDPKTHGIGTPYFVIESDSGNVIEPVRIAETDVKQVDKPGLPVSKPKDAVKSVKGAGRGKKAKFTDEQIIKMYDLLVNTSFTIKYIADQFRVSTALIGNIKANRADAYKHLYHHYEKMVADKANGNSKFKLVRKTEVDVSNEQPESKVVIPDDKSFVHPTKPAAPKVVRDEAALAEMKQKAIPPGTFSREQAAIEENAGMTKKSKVSNPNKFGYGAIEMLPMFQPLGKDDSEGAYNELGVSDISRHHPSITRTYIAGAVLELSDRAVNGDKLYFKYNGRTYEKFSSVGYLVSAIHAVLWRGFSEKDQDLAFVKALHDRFYKALESTEGFRHKVWDNVCRENRGGVNRIAEIERYFEAHFGSSWPSAVSSGRRRILITDLEKELKAL